MEVIRTDKPEQEAGLNLSSLLFQYQERPVLLLLSGGSSFSLLPYVDTASLLEHVTIGVVDERSTEDPAASNFLKLQATDFYQAGVKAGVGVLAPKFTQGVSDREVAKDWDEALRGWFIHNPGGVCITTLGIGPDGHIAGMFPGEWNVNFSGDAWTVAYEVPPSVNSYNKRLTLTNTFLIHQVNHAIVYAVGTEKELIIKTLLEKTPELNNLPVRILYQMPEVQFYTDIV